MRLNIFSLILEGKLIDISEAKSYIDTYFAHISKLSQDQKISVRVRFMFQVFLNTIISNSFKAVMELRQNKWVPRREENAPKKISEIHADALQKQLAEEMGTYSLFYSSNQQGINISPRITPSTTPTLEPKSTPAVISNFFIFNRD